MKSDKPKMTNNNILTEEKILKLTKFKSNKKLSHLCVNGKQIDEIGNLGQYKNLKIIYLHNNNIRVIQNMNNFLLLTHLYLQWNKIEKIENLNNLRNLRKLYLGYNKIERLENLDELRNLEELHIEKQNLQNKEFTFDVKCLQSIARNLKLLNVTGLKLTNLEPLVNLAYLKVLLASENLFQDAKEIGIVLGRLQFLENADFHGCPAQKDIHYRNKITAGSCNLEILDGKLITEQHRIFMKRFEQIKLERKSEIFKMAKSQSPKIGKNLNLNVEKKFLTSKLKTNDSVYLLSNSAIDEIGFRNWNSLNSLQKPKRTIKKNNNKELSKSKTEYPLQGKNIKN